MLAAASRILARYYGPKRLEEELFLVWLLSHTKTKTEEDKSVAYSVMVWLVDPGEQAHQPEAMQRTTTGRFRRK
jgi:hypothetical protein